MSENRDHLSCRVDRAIRSLPGLLLFLAVSVSSAGHTANVEAIALGGVVVDGNVSYAPEQLAPAYRQHLGRRSSPEVVESIVERLYEMYASDGHLKPTIVVDETFENGRIVRLRITESRIDAIQVDGDVGPYRPQVEEWVASLRRADSTSREQIRAGLRRMRRLPGLSVSADLHDRGVSAGRVLRLAFAYEPTVGLLKITNRVPETFGTNIVFGRFRANGRLGLGETLDVLAAASMDYDRYRGAGVMVGKTINDNGTHVSLLGFHSRGRLDTEMQPSLEAYQRQKYRLRMEQPIVREDNARISVSASLYARNLLVEQQDKITRNEHLRSISLGAHYAARAADQTINRGEVEFRMGLSGLGSRLGTSSLDDPRRADFRLMEFGMERETRLGDAWELELNVRGQFSGNVLPGSERFTIGGRDIGRAFDPAELTGDSGLGGKIELGRTTPVPFFSDAFLYGFYDIGAVWRNSFSDRQSAASTGSGIAFETERLRTYIELVHPLTHPSASFERDPKLFAEVAYRF
jgi:hemolysin activation/secretion protein